MEGRVLHEGVASFLFLEIPDRIKASDIFDLFGCHGDVVEVVIPPRRNKVGKRYEFARISNVEDATMLVMRLDNIMIDGRKIHANMSRFERNRGFGVPEATRFGEGRKNAFGKDKVTNDFQKDGVDRGSNNGVWRGFSFAYVVSKGKTEKGDKIIMEKAFVGIVLYPDASYNVQTSFEMEGVFSVKVTSLRENICLLE